MNSLGSSKETVQNKLIVMYIMNRLDIPVSNSHITRLVLETRLMNYFIFQQCFNELHGSKLIEQNDGNVVKSKAGTGRNAASGRYILTEMGRKTLQYFSNLIAPGIKKQLERITSATRKKIRDEALVVADFIAESENEFIVALKIGEDDFSLIELKAAVGTKKDARSVCENWQTHSSEIYAEIIESLTKTR